MQDAASKNHRIRDQNSSTDANVIRVHLHPLKAENGRVSSVCNRLGSPLPKMHFVVTGSGGFLEAYDQAFPQHVQRFLDPRQFGRVPRIEHPSDLPFVATKLSC